MKATDLMLGDWVTLADALKAGKFYPIKITSLILSNRIAGYHPNPAIEGADVYSEDDLVGIPLTPEILEKNGFIIKHPESEKRTYWRDRAGQIVGHKNRGLMYMEIHGNPKKFGYFIPQFSGHIYFVHELQHTLRLCGIEKEIEL